MNYLEIQCKAATRENFKNLRIDLIGVIRPRSQCILGLMNKTCRRRKDNRNQRACHFIIGQSGICDSMIKNKLKQDMIFSPVETDMIRLCSLIILRKRWSWG